MDKGELREELKALKVKKDSLRKRIASISGPASTKLSRQLDEIEKKISDVETRMKKGGVSHVPFDESSGEDDGKHASSPVVGADIAPSVEEIDQLRERVRKLKRELTILGGLRVLSVCLIIFGLLCMWLYLRGLTSRTDETRPVGNQDVDVIIIYPCTLKKGSWRELRCVATRRNSLFYSKVFIELIPPSSDFYIEGGTWGYEFDFSKLSSPTKMEWTTKVKYQLSESLLGGLSDLVTRRHVDAALKDVRGKLIDGVCLSFQVHTFYFALLSVLAWLGGIFAATKSDIIYIGKSCCKKLFSKWSELR